jgi:hypothetical protein
MTARTQADQREAAENVYLRAILGDEVFQMLEAERRRYRQQSRRPSTLARKLAGLVFGVGVAGLLFSLGGCAADSPPVPTPPPGSTTPGVNPLLVPILAAQ